MLLSTLQKFYWLQIYVHKELSALKVELEWFKLAQDRQAWKADCYCTHLART